MSRALPGTKNFCLIESGEFVWRLLCMGVSLHGTCRGTGVYDGRGVLYSVFYRVGEDVGLRSCATGHREEISNAPTSPFNRILLHLPRLVRCPPCVTAQQTEGNGISTGDVGHKTLYLKRANRPQGANILCRDTKQHGNKASAWKTSPP